MEHSPTVLCCRWIPWAASSLSHAAWDRRPHLRGPRRLRPAPNHCTDAKTRLRMRHLMSWASFTNITAEIKVWISDYIHCFMWGVITYPFFNFNGGYNSIAIKVRLWMSNYIHCFMWGVITYPFFNFNGSYNSIAIKVRLWMSNYSP